MKDYKGVLLTPKLPRDDNEFARYLAQYLYDNEERWNIQMLFGKVVDREKLEEVIATYMENQF